MKLIYENSLQHIQDELKRLDLMLKIQVSGMRAMLQGEDNPFHGICLSDHEIDRVLCSDENAAKVSSEITDALEIMSAQINERKRASIDKGIFLGLPELSSLCNLNNIEELAVLICLAPELDPKYESIYAYLNNDATQKKPTVGLVLDMACKTAQEKIKDRLCFCTYSPLSRYNILSLGESNTLITRSLRLDERLVHYILGLNSIAEGTEEFLTIVQTRNSLADENLKYRLVRLLQHNEKTIVHLRGPYGAGKKELAKGICFEFNLPLIVVDMEGLITAPEFESLLRRSMRETLLLPAAIYFENFDILLEEDKREKLKTFLRAVDEISGITFTAGEMRWEPRGRPICNIELPYPDCNARALHWKKALEGMPLSEDLRIDTISSKIKLTAGQIRDAAKAAGSYALLRDPEEGRINNEDLSSGCRAQSNQKLSSLARKINPFYSWSDIILPEDSMAQLREIYNQVKYRQKVFGEWGFERKLSLGRGLYILFSGPSGTGKTMAADIVARELELDLYKIDLSCVVSKYIGDTEKNISRIFLEAQTSNAIIFFDEADSLFGKRSEVKDSHDRYANIEINYLLQKMEEYEGIIILATNLKKHIDEAFLRRIHFIIEFPFPDEIQRRKIWESMFPKEAIKADIDFGFLAQQFKITGGNIKNIVLNAAFLAASNSGVIDMDHIILSTKREYEKIGKMLMESDFGKYYSLVRMEK